MRSKIFSLQNGKTQILAYNMA